MTLSNKDAVWKFINEYYKKEKIVPTQKRIAEEFDVTLNYVRTLMAKLKQEGLIRPRVFGTGYVIIGTFYEKDTRWNG